MGPLLCSVIGVVMGLMGRRLGHLVEIIRGE